MIVIYITIFSYITITVTKDLTDNFVSYMRLVLQKNINKVMIDLDIEKFATYINAAKRFAV